MRTVNDSSTKGLRDKFEAIQYFRAVVYEGMRTFWCMKNQLSSLPSYKRHIQDINYICWEIDNNKSFTKTILAKIRDKLVFHFDKNVFKKALSNMSLSNNEFTILESDSFKNIDANATSTTELYFNYLISQLNQNISDEEKLELIYDKTIILSKKLTNTLENIVSDLLDGILECKEE